MPPTHLLRGRMELSRTCGVNLLELRGNRPGPRRRGRSCPGSRPRRVSLQLQLGFSTGIAAVSRGNTWLEANDWFCWTSPPCATGPRSTISRRCRAPAGHLRNQRDEMQVDRTGLHHLFGAARRPPDVKRPGPLLHPQHRRLLRELAVHVHLGAAQSEAIRAI